MWNLIFGFIFAFIIGLFIGSFITLIHFQREKITGILVVDHQTEQCYAKILNDDITKLTKKRAVFLIDHNGNISRQDHTL